MNDRSDGIASVALPAGMTPQELLRLYEQMLLLRRFGLALDSGPALLLLAPVLLPITRSMGIDDIHFSMVMIVSVTLGLISPPVGICLFLACKIGNISMRVLWSELALFFYAEIAVIVVLSTFRSCRPACLTCCAAVAEATVRARLARAPADRVADTTREQP